MAVGYIGSASSLYGGIILGLGAETAGDVTTSCSNSFGWSSLAEHNYVQVVCSNSLGWVQLSGRNYDLDVIQYFGWTPRTVKGCINNLALGAVVGQVIYLDAGNDFGWSALVTQTHLASNNFGFSQLLVGIRLFDATNSLGLDGVADSSPTNYGRGQTHAMLRQYVSYTISGKKCLEQNYNPLIGEGEDGYDAMPSAPTLTSGTLTLTYPVAGPTHTLTLRNPAFGNSDALQFTVIDRKTRGGERILYADTKWSSAEVRTLQIANLCSSDWTDLVDFLNASLGKEIGLHDWEGRDWTGVIIAPETRVEMVRDGFNITLQFQGELA